MILTYYKLLGWAMEFPCPIDYKTKGTELIYFKTVDLQSISANFRKVIIEIHVLLLKIMS